MIIKLGKEYSNYAFVDSKLKQRVKKTKGTYIMFFNFPVTMNCTVTYYTFKSLDNLVKRVRVKNQILTNFMLPSFELGSA